MSSSTPGQPPGGPPAGAAPSPGRFRGILVDVEPLRRDRDFRALWLGQLVSGIGRQVTVVALPLEVYLLTRSTLAVGLVALVQLVPILVFGLGGGAIADAMDRRRLLLVTQLGLAVTSVAFFILALQPAPPAVLFYVVAFLSAGIGAVDQPTRSAATPRLVPRERLRAALTLNQLSFQVQAVTGPALGGILAATVGIPAAFLFDAITFAAALLAVFLIAPLPPLPGAPRPSLASIAEGLRFTRARRAVFASFVVDLDAMIFGMPSSLFPAIAIDVMKASPAAVGFLAASPGIGALLAALLTGSLSRVVRPGRAVVLAVAGWGLAIVGFGVASASLVLSMVFLALAGAADVISAILRSVIVQFETPDALRGRVMSINGLVVTSGPRLGDVEAAAVAALVGPQLSVISGGLLCLVGLVGVVRLFPELMRYRLQGGPTAGDDGEAAPRPEAAGSET